MKSPSPQPSQFAGLAALAAWASAGLGLFALGTWGFGAWRITTFGPDYIPMAPTTALLVLILGSACGLRLFRPDSVRVQDLALAGAALAAGLGALELLGAQLNFSLPWDRWHSAADGLTVGGVPIGRMAPITATTMVLFAVAMAGTIPRLAGSPWMRWISGFAAGTVFLVSTVVLIGYLSGAPLGYGTFTIPMALLTAIAFNLLSSALLLTRDAEFAPGSSGGSDPEFFRLLVGGTAAVFILFVAGGVFYLRAHHRQAEASTMRDLETISGLKLQQIEQWRRERLDDARFLRRTDAVAQDIAALLQQPGDPVAANAVRNWLAPMLGQNRYAAILVLDPAGRVRLAVPETAPAADLPSGPDLTATLAAADATMGEIQRNGTPDGIRLDVRVPIPGPGGAAVAAVVLRVDPRQAFFPMLRTWPVPSRSAESVLVRREGENVVFLSAGSDRPDAALNLQFPVSTPNLPAATAVRGETGVRVGRDYRGVPVFTSIRAVPDSTWHLVTKVDQAEILGAATGQFWPRLILVGVLLAAVMLAAALLLRQRRASFLERELLAERQRAMLARRLALVTDHANDIILTFDEGMRIIDANQRALVAYGYTADEIRQRRATDLRAQQTLDRAPADFSRAMHSEGFIFETEHRRKDGSTFPVEVSTRSVEIEGDRTVLSIVRDISERRMHAREVERLNRLYLVLSRINSALVHADSRDELFQQICAILVETGGFKLVWVGWLDPESRRVIPIATAGDEHGYVPQLRVSADAALPGGRGPSGTAMRENRTYVCNNFVADPSTGPWREAAARSGIASSIALPLSQEGAVMGTLTVYAAEQDYFQRREIDLLEEATRDLSYGLKMFAERAGRKLAEDALAANEARLQFLLSETPAIIYALRAGGDYGTTFLSGNVRTVLGYEPADFTSDPGFWFAQVHPEDRYRAKADFSRLGEVPLLVREYRYRHRNGDYRWMRDETRIARDTEGRTRELVGCWLDVTERKQTEAALRESEGRLRALFDTSLDGVLVTDAVTGQILSANPAACAILRRTEAEIQAGGRNLLADRNDPRLAVLLEERRRTGKTQGELTLVRGDGSSFEAEISSVIFSFSESSRAGIVFRDITERRRTEGQLRKLSSIVEQAPVSIIITDLDGRIEYVNPTFTAVTGYTPAEAVGQNPRVLKSGETPQEVFREMWSTLERGKIWSGELHNRRKNGENFIENAVIAPVVDEHGRPTHYVAMKEDVTTQRRTIALLAKEREVSEMKSRFLSVTSHEFRTPMSAALGSVELLANHLERLAPEKRRELLDRITTSLHRMTEMLDEILLLNRIDAKRVEVKLAPQDLRPLVEGIIEEARVGDRGSHRFELQVEGDPQGFVTDANLLHHILANLLSNAVRYSPAGQPVTVQLAMDGAGARLAVTDRGIGIPPADLARLFQPFERGSNVGNIKGTGLGLSIVKRMVELLGGTIAVEAPAEGGTRFAVLLPGGAAPAGRHH
jgi:PAS domain S-box-containing protein